MPRRVRPGIITQYSIQLLIDPPVTSPRDFPILYYRVTYRVVGPGNLHDNQNPQDNTPPINLQQQQQQQQQQLDPQELYQGQDPFTQQEQAYVAQYEKVLRFDVVGRLKGHFGR